MNSSIILVNLEISREFNGKYKKIVMAKEIFGPENLPYGQKSQFDWERELFPSSKYSENVCKESSEIAP